MKKVLALILIMFVLPFTGCQTQTEPSENDSEYALQSDVAVSINENIEEEAYVEEYQLSFYSYDEYVKFTQTADLPEYFVSFEDISEFGEFSGFVCLSKSEHGDYSSLFYTFVDETGTESSMYVDYIPKGSLTNEETAKPILGTAIINASDMRTANVTESSKYLYNGIEYSYYSSGKLHSITWCCGDIEYKLHENLSKYPTTDKATAISKLLNLQTAADVMQSFVSENDTKEN